MFSSTAPPQTARLSQAKSRKAPAHLPLAAASRPGLCDARDQISLDPSLSSWLPPGAKVKHVVAADRDLVLAAYSLPSEGRSNELWVAVLMRADGGPTHRLVSAARVSGEGRESFCGLYVLGRTGFMVVLEEATGSSDYLVARGFTVDRPSAGR